MKKLFPLLLIILMLITGCFSTTEEISVQKDGSGLYGVTLDFSGIFDLMQAMQNEENAGGLDKLPTAMDTLIRFASFTDTSTKMTATEKALLKDATMRMIMKQADKQFRMELRFPFKKMEDVEKIMALSQRNGNMMSKIMGSPDAGAEPQVPAPDFNSYYDVSFKKGLLEKKLNADKLKEFQQNPQYEQMKMSSAMFADATISTVVNLPAKAKKVEGPHAKTSDDGKTVTITASMSDVLEDPNALTFRIQY